MYRDTSSVDCAHWGSARLEVVTHAFSFYIADMPRPTEPVKRICYADDITVWASGVEISELEHKINTYLTEMSRFLRENSLLISAPKVISDLVYDRPGAGQYPPEDQDR